MDGLAQAGMQQAPAVDEQMVQQVAQALMQGATPEELMQQGVPQEVIQMAIEMVKAHMQQQQVAPQEAPVDESMGLAAQGM